MVSHGKPFEIAKLDAFPRFHRRDGEFAADRRHGARRRHSGGRTDQRGRHADVFPSAYRGDAAVLRRALEMLHPGLYRYNSPVELERRFGELEERLASASTPGAAYLAIARFTSTLRCGHTFPNPANQPNATADAVFRRTPRVPFYFRWLDGRMVVTHDASAEHAFPRGTEVLAINGVPTATILSRLLEYARTDGANEAKRLANLSVDPAERWEAFDVYFPLVFPQPLGPMDVRGAYSDQVSPHRSRRPRDGAAADGGV